MKSDEMCVRKRDMVTYPIPATKHREVNTLIRNECCNYDNGNCVLLDNGDYHKCPQIASEMLMCAWFSEAVLPLVPALEVSIARREEPDAPKTIPCANCNANFVPKSNKSKYCKKCAPKVAKVQATERQRKKRSLSRNRPI